MTRTTRLTAALLLLAALFCGASACEKDKPEQQCAFGNDIEQAKLDSISAKADQLAYHLVQGELDKLYEEGSKELKEGQTRDQFTFALGLFIKVFGSIDYPRMEEVYHITTKSEEESVWVACNLGEPGINDLYSMPANEEMAVAVYRARSELESIRMVFQLQMREGEWKLRSVAVNPETIKRKTGDYYLKKALEYLEQNRVHLAVLYMKTSILLHDMGINVNEFTTSTIQKQLEQLKVDYMPMGQPQIWATRSGKNYNVYTLDTAYDKGNLLVQINYLTDSLKDEEKLSREAHDLARFLDRKFPEYRLGFDGFRVTAAPEAPDELLRSYHTLISYDELDAIYKKEGLSIPSADAPAPKTPAGPGAPSTPDKDVGPDNKEGADKEPGAPPDAAQGPAGNNSEGPSDGASAEPGDTAPGSTAAPDAGEATQ